MKLVKISSIVIGVIAAAVTIRSGIRGFQAAHALPGSLDLEVVPVLGEQIQDAALAASEYRARARAATGAQAVTAEARAARADKAEVDAYAETLRAQGRVIGDTGIALQQQVIEAAEADAQVVAASQALIEDIFQYAALARAGAAVAARVVVDAAARVEQAKATVKVPHGKGWTWFGWMRNGNSEYQAAVKAHRIARDTALAMKMDALKSSRLARSLVADGADFKDGTTAFVTAAVATGVGIASVTTLMITNAITKKLNGTGYDTIKAGKSHRYGRMTLSLWQQCVCRKTTTIGSRVQIDTIYMRPIFSGPTIDSNLAYDIQSWIDNHGIDHSYTIGANKPRGLEENEDAKSMTNATVQQNRT